MVSNNVPKIKIWSEVQVKDHYIDHSSYFIFALKKGYTIY